MKNNLLNTERIQKFEFFFASNYPMVKKFALMLLKSAEDAEDIAQEVFTRLWDQPDLWEDQEHINSFLYTMTRNLILNQIKHHNITTAYRENYSAKILQDEAYGLKDMLNPIYYKETLLLIELTLEKMPEKRKKIFRMSRFEDMSNKQIAEILGISIRTVENQIYLATCELKKTIVFSWFLFLVIAER